MFEIKVLAGINSIGGIFVRIKDEDQILIFDQGIRFDIMANYYSAFITPRGISELRDLGVLPKAEWYEDVKSIYISHMHLDHLGALSNIPQETTVYLPSISIYEDMEERWSTSPTWLSLIPKKYYINLEEIKPFEADKNNVMAIPVSHSAYPSYALLYFGKNKTVLYTGDFRIESFLTQDEFNELKNGQDLFSFLNENQDIKIDIAIIEGTNIGSSRLPLAPKEAMNITKRLASSHKPIIATLHSLDFEYAYTLLKLAKELNMDCCIASTQMSKLLEKLPKLPVKPKLIENYVDYLTPLEKIPLEEIKEDTLILISYREVIDFLRDLSLTSDIIKNSVAIMSEPEPQIEEASEYEVIANWLLKMGIQFYRIRVSGHYYPYQLKTIIKSIKPKEVIPIHTLYPNYLENTIKIIQI
jgi:ribonuclease J